ncbi:MAG: Fe-S cluster assembly protein SufD [Acidobacteria bacterium]|nr:Fe-S cluster assembly protein SufD [Acidobacteriota bacterium]
MTVAEAQDLYVARFEELGRRRASAEPAWLQTIRKAAIQRFGELGFPTTRDEDWRFTSVAPIANTPFRAAGDVPVEVSKAMVAPFAVRRLSCTLLTFVNGRFSRELSSFRALPAGAQVGSLADFLELDPGIVDPYLTRCTRDGSHAFCALNTALVEDGAVIYLPANAVVSEPIHVLYVTSAPEPLVTHPRTLVVAGDNSQATVIESYGGGAGEIYFTNAVTEFVVGEHARVEHYRVQRESLEAYHVSNTGIYLERDAVFAQQNIVFGGRLVRNDVGAVLDASGIECTLNGLYLGSGDRLIANHTAIDHAKPHCESHEIYKGMLDGSSRGVFNGKIFVRQDAQKTDAKQTNQVLLLSDDATINTKPQLEIFADDVKCTHGATVGQLDDEALFYLRARGIGRDEARAILVHAFASDIIDRVKVEPLRAALEDTLLGQLPGEAVV